MTDDEKHPDRGKPANDNHAPDKQQESGGKAEASEQFDAVVLSIARLIGRQMAREDFAALVAANDNRAPSGDRQERAEDEDE